MKRDWSGCERRRCLRPPSQIPSAARRSRSGVCPAFGPGLQRHVRTRPSRRAPTTPCADIHPGVAVAAGWIRVSRHSGEANLPPSCWQSAVGRLMGNRPARGAAEGAANPRGSSADRERRGREGSASGRVRNGYRRPVASEPPRRAAITFPVRASHHPTCGLRPRGAPPGRPGAAWRASPRYRGQSPSCRASCHRRRRGCPS